MAACASAIVSYSTSAYPLIQAVWFSRKVSKTGHGDRKDRRTLTYPVLRSRFMCRFLISPYSANLSIRSSSVASSCTPVTSTIQPSTAGNNSRQGISSGLRSDKESGAHIAQPSFLSPGWTRPYRMSAERRRRSRSRLEKDMLPITLRGDETTAITCRALEASALAPDHASIGGCAKNNRSE